MKKVLCFLLAVIMALAVMPAIAMAEDKVTYLLRDVNDGSYTEVAMDKYQTYETEHFQIFYDTDGANSHKVTEDFLKQCETVLENCWDLYMVKMGMEPTSTSVEPWGDKVTQYKTNVILMGTGVEHYDLGANDWGAYGSVDTAGYPYFMCCLAAMNSPSVVAHEFGHSTHYAQGDNAWKDNIFMGPWFEAVANWFAEQYIYEYLSPNQTQMSSLYLRATHLTKMNGRGYYEAWPILQYLHEDPDNTGVYGEKFVQKLLSTNLGSTNVLMWEVLEKANGESLTTADTVGMYASHMATMDFAKKDYYNAKINAEMNAKVLYWQQRYTPLEDLDGEGTYSVPTEKAPQAMGYNIIPITFTPGEVKVKINPLTEAEGAHWRGRLVRERNGVTSYSPLFSEGEEASIEAESGDALYLTVAATPDIDTIVKHTIGGWATHSTENNMPFENKTLYPYSVTMEGCTPMKRPNTGFGMMTIHPNGGGRKSFNAKVADTAYIGENAIVWGNATVSDNAVIDGYAIVGGNAVVKDNAYVGDYAIVYDRAQVSGNARVIENACIYVDYKVGGSAVVKGSSLGLYNGSATGEAITYGDWFEDLGKHVTAGSYSGYHSLDDGQYVASRTAVPALRSAYRFDENIRDSVAYSDMYAVGDVVHRDGCVVTDENSYLALNESALYYDNVRLQLKFKGEGEVLSIGEDIALNAEGSTVTLTVGDSTAEVAQEDEWKEVSIEFEGGEVILTVNGKKAKGTASVTPLEAVRSGESYLGRGFNGEIDYLYIFDTSCEEETTGTTLKVNNTAFSAPRWENGALSDKTADTNSVWYGWECADGAVTVDGGLNFKGNIATVVTAPGYETDKFVIEFNPEGGKAYPDHGVLDTDGDVLFAHRYATDANAIYVGRGETNDAVRGSYSVTDTATQKRLTNFAAEKLYMGSSRSDRGGLVYNTNSTVRITAENFIWNDTLAEFFTEAENVSENLEKLTNGDEIYLVTYTLLSGGLETPVSVSVYKGNFEGFGGFKVAGGAADVTVSYKNLKVYTFAEGKIVREGNRVKGENFEGEGIMIFALYEDKTLMKVETRAFTGEEEITVPEGFENATVMAFNSKEGLTPLAERK